MTLTLAQGDRDVENLWRNIGDFQVKKVQVRPTAEIAEIETKKLLTLIAPSKKELTDERNILKKFATSKICGEILVIFNRRCSKWYRLLAPVRKASLTL